MSKKRASMELHDFYCIGCGNKGIALQRKTGFKHSSHHRKKLYCIYCKSEVNHIECQTYEDVENFKNNYKNGVYDIERQESFHYVRSQCLG